MAFKTKKEKYAYVKGIKKGMRGGKPYGKKKKPRKTGKRPSSGAKSQPVYDYSKYYDWDSRGNIKGSYTVDGFFEPD